jgi:hypothetical protein
VTAQFVILVGSDEDSEQREEPPEAVRSAVAAQGGTVELLDSGQMVAVLSGTRSPEEEAARAARVALALRASLPDAPMTLVADCSSSPDLGVLIERGVHAIQLESMETLFAGVLSDDVSAGGIRLDNQAVRLLEPQFKLVKRQTAAYLVGDISAATP